MPSRLESAVLEAVSEGMPSELPSKLMGWRPKSVRDKELTAYLRRGGVCRLERGVGVGGGGYDAQG